MAKSVFGIGIRGIFLFIRICLNNKYVGKGPVYKLFNIKDTDIIYSGESNGTIRIWEITKCKSNTTFKMMKLNKPL